MLKSEHRSLGFTVNPGAVLSLKKTTNIASLLSSFVSEFMVPGIVRQRM